MLRYKDSIDFYSAAGWPMRLVRQPTRPFPVVLCRDAADGHSEGSVADHDDADAMTTAIHKACITDLDRAADLLERDFKIT